MSYTIHIVDENLVPISATAEVSDYKGATLQRITVPVTGADLDATAVQKGSNVLFTKYGYYDFSVPVGSLWADQVNDISLQKKPTSVLLAFAVGAAVLYAITKIFK